MAVHYAMMNSGMPVRVGASVITPTPGGSGGANYMLDNAGYIVKFTNIDQQTRVTNTRYINGGSSDWERTYG